MYTPPFKITSKILNLVAEISGKIERYAIWMEGELGVTFGNEFGIKFGDNDMRVLLLLNSDPTLPKVKGAIQI